MSTDLVLHEPIPQDETKEQRRKRLSVELRYLVSLFNSKLLECDEAELTILTLQDEGEVELLGNEAIIIDTEISYQPKPKVY